MSPDRSGDDRYLLAVDRFNSIQEFLELVGEGRAVPRSFFPSILHMREWASNGLGPGAAKRAQLEDGRPLTVCVGRTYREETRDGRMRSVRVRHRLSRTLIDWNQYGDGCGIVFADSTSERRFTFASYCPVCREKSEVRRCSDLLSRAVRFATDGRFPVPGGWSTICTGCRKRFVARAPRRSRCDDCQH